MPDAILTAKGLARLRTTTRPPLPPGTTSAHRQCHLPPLPPMADAAFLPKLCLSALAASAAETATFPLDLLKTRLQLQGQQLLQQQQQQQAQQLGKAAATAATATATATATSPPTPLGLLATLRSIIRHEGFLGLYAGLSPAVLRHIPYTGIRVLTFEQLRSLAQHHLLPPPPHTASSAPAGKQQPQQQLQKLPLPVNLAMGLTAGALGQAVAVPADLVKVRMQADGRLVAAGLQAAPRYRGVGHAFASILRQQGPAGLWRGSLPAVQRAALVNLGELTTYDAAKQAVLRSGVTGGDNVWAHALSSMCSGFCASVVSTPADVVKTRLMNQSPQSPMYRGVLHCLAATYRAEGWRGLYSGFFPTWARLGPWQLVFWTTYEQLRQLSGLGGF